MYWGDTLILDEGSLEIEKVHKNVFHFKRKGERGNNDFYKLNTLSKEFLRVEGEFGKAGGKERNTHVNVALSRIKSFPKEGKKNADREKAFKEMARQSMLRFKKPELPNPDGIEVWEDFAFKDHEIKKPESNWMESQKTLNEKLLLNNFYDIMVVPFQVQGYGIDKAGRSLMTQFLIDRIEASSKLKVVDSTLLERALGERKRTYNMEKIYELANDLNVKKIIIGYVGHDLDMKMRLTLLVKEASKEELFTEKTKTTTLDRKNLPFSDEHLPYAVFNNLIDSNIIKLPIKLGKYPSAKQYKQIKKLPLPNKIMDMVEGAKKSPLMTAYYLQFLGMLSPEKSLNKEILFGRSLIALSKISEKSPEYKLLKSRALFYLSRRPAALKALGTPKTTDEKAFFALLNGNLPDLKSWLNKIDSPFHKLMAQIELYDLEWSYSNKIADELDIESIVKSNLGLAAELYQRFTSKDDRIIPNNLLVKKQLDENFPIEGFTIESIMKSRAAMGSGSLDDDEIYLS
ncbi:hypothetical protein KAR91_75605, partial [Candidatus Pacearchaeota archaeon]|nr:hypothetical protein [Candidatus Pacearchaeota archaeon]